MPDENNFQLMFIGNQWYVIGNGFKMPVEDEMSGLLLIDQLDKEAREAKSGNLTPTPSPDSDHQ